ncbi:hypothetical protein AURDEDRAFT_172348 [Auricularia subglabra TFB-10046 SS5]|nr:hypothetical protein AURDEDRAFT_172348 [Auricularia subglabra TFB-10046 SS5]
MPVTFETIFRDDRMVCPAGKPYPEIFTSGIVVLSQDLHEPHFQPPGPAVSLSPSPEHTGWQPGWGSGWSVDRPPEPWHYDAHPSQSGWNAGPDGHGAALFLSAAFTNHHVTGELAPAVDMRWHRRDQDNVHPLGHGPRGDVAPDDVHTALDGVLQARTLSPFEIRLLHAWIDRVWLLHSRSHFRCVPALRQLGFFGDDEVNVLAAALRANALTDFRVLMLALDPRETPIYGRTREGPGISRLFRRFRSTFTRSPRTEEQPAPNHAEWSDDDGGLSGSSDEGANPSVPYYLTAVQREEQRIRHAERRLRRVYQIADSAEREAQMQEARIVDELVEQLAPVYILIQSPPQYSRRATPVFRVRLWSAN